MTTIKSYTDVSQSKKLAEILPIESADMEYMFLKEDNSKVSNIPFVKDDEEPEWPTDSAYDFIPSWSLSALLNVLPKSLIYTPNQALDGYCCKNIMHDLETYGDNPVDACHEMVLRLHELKML